MLPTKAAGAAGHTWADARVSGQLSESSAPFPECGLAGSGCSQGAGEGGQADRASCTSFSFSEKQKEASSTNFLFFNQEDLFFFFTLQE